MKNLLLSPLPTGDARHDLAGRHLPSVIEEILAVAPDLKSYLAPLWNKAQSSAPEMTPYWWGVTAACLSEAAKEHLQFDEIERIFAGREHDIGSAKMLAQMIAPMSLEVALAHLRAFIADGDEGGEVSQAQAMNAHNAVCIHIARMQMKATHQSETAP